MEKITHISNELKEWLLKTLHSGVKPEQLVDALIKKGFDSEIFLYSYISNDPKSIYRYQRWKSNALSK